MRNQIHHGRNNVGVWSGHDPTMQSKAVKGMNSLSFAKLAKKGTQQGQHPLLQPS